MLLYLLLIIIFAMLILTAIGTLVFGLIKNRKNVVIMAAIIFVIGIAGCAFSAFAYAKQLANYVRSTEFQNDTKKGSALAGQTIGSVSSGISGGLATTLDDEAIAKLANKSANIIGKSIKAMASAFDSTIGNKNIFLDSSLENSGLEFGRAEEKYQPKSNELNIFIDFKKDFKGKLKMMNYDQNGRKIDFSEKEINAKAGEGKVEVFSFPHADLGITTYYILSKNNEE